MPSKPRTSFNDIADTGSSAQIFVSCVIPQGQTHLRSFHLLLCNFLFFSCLSVLGFLNHMSSLAVRIDRKPCFSNLKNCHSWKHLQVPQNWPMREWDLSLVRISEYPSRCLAYGQNTYLFAIWITAGNKVCHEFCFWHIDIKTDSPLTSCTASVAFLKGLQKIASVKHKLFRFLPFNFIAPTSV